MARLVARAPRASAARARGGCRPLSARWRFVRSRWGCVARRAEKGGGAASVADAQRPRKQRRHSANFDIVVDVAIVAFVVVVVVSFSSSTWSSWPPSLPSPWPSFVVVGVAVVGIAAVVVVVAVDTVVAVPAIAFALAFADVVVVDIGGRRPACARARVSSDPPQKRSAS